MTYKGWSSIGRVPELFSSGSRKVLLSLVGVCAMLTLGINPAQRMVHHLLTTQVALPFPGPGTGSASVGIRSITYGTSVDCGASGGNPSTCAITGLASGDAVFTFFQAYGGTNPTLSSSDCSSSGQSTNIAAGSTTAKAFWCIASGTSVTVGSTYNNASDFIMVPFHPVNGSFNPSSENSCGVSITATSTPTTCSISASGSVSAVVGYIGSVYGGTMRTTGPWSQGSTADYVSYSVGYQINVGAASYSPSFSSTNTTHDMPGFAFVVSMN